MEVGVVDGSFFKKLCKWTGSKWIIYTWQKSLETRIIKL